MIRSWFWLLVLVVMLALGIGCAYRAAGALGVAIYAPFIGAAVADALTPLGLLNFLVLQWFGVRLAACYEWHWVALEDIPKGGIGAAEQRRVRVGWQWKRWIIPLTGWWTDYRYIARRS